MEKSAGKNVREPVFRKYARTYRNLLVISIAALTINTGASIFFFLKWSEAADRYLMAVTEQNTKAHELTLARIENERLQRQLAVIRDPAIDAVRLIPRDSAANYRAVVYYNNYTGEIYFDLQSLPFPSDDQQYQLWARVDSQYVNVATLNFEEDWIQQMRPVSRVSEWAVTIEPKGGSEIPSQQNIIVQSRAYAAMVPVMKSSAASSNPIRPKP